MAEVAGPAYVTVAPSLKGWESKLNKQIATPLDKAGKSGGQSLTAAFGKVAKTGMKVAAVGVGAVVGTALSKGFGRLKGIEDAEAKLRGLGNSAKSIDKIMANALESVKGTAFGLDEAATTAAGAVAAGIKPGQQLAKYLGTVADVAAQTNTSMEESGRVLNKARTIGAAYNDTLQTLAERGLPVYQLLSKELGVSAGEVKDLASKGKISAGVLEKALRRQVGGAAMEAGKTTSGAFKNMNAALGRLGASALSGVFPKLSGGMGSVTKRLDELGPAAEKFGRGFGTFIEDVGPPTVDVLKSIADAGKTVAPVLKAIAGGFAALPGGAQKILLLAGAALVLKSRFDIATPSLANFDRQAALTTAKSVGLKVGALGAAAGFATLASKTGGASSSLDSLATVGAGAAAGFAVGGPWGAAFGAAGGVLSIFTSKSDAAAASQARFKAAGAAVVATLNQQTGALSAASRAAAAKSLQDSGALTIAEEMGISLADVTDAALGNRAAFDRVNAATNRYVAAQGDSYGANLAAKASVDVLSKSIGGVQSNINGFRRGLNQTNEALGKLDGKKVAAEIRINGLGGALAGLAAVGSRLDSIIAKNAKVKVGNNAKGTDNWRGGLTWVGERGPELINLPKGSQVHTAQESKRIANMKPKTAAESSGSSTADLQAAVTRGVIKGLTGATWRADDRGNMRLHSMGG